MSRERPRFSRLALASCVAVLVCAGSVYGGPVFFASAGANPSGDLAWQTAVGSFVEEDFQSYGQYETLSSLTLGGITVDVSLPNVPASAGEVFWGAYAGGGG